MIIGECTGCAKAIVKASCNENIFNNKSILLLCWKSITNWRGGGVQGMFREGNSKYVWNMGIYEAVY